MRMLFLAALLSLPLSPAFALEDPGYDSGAHCVKSSAYVRSPSLESFCLQRETEARDRLLRLDPHPERLASCLEEAGERGASYSLLEECLNREPYPEAK